jgi:hypothetical protein
MSKVIGSILDLSLKRYGAATSIILFGHRDPDSSEAVPLYELKRTHLSNHFR